MKVVQCHPPHPRTAWGIYIDNHNETETLANRVQYHTQPDEWRSKFSHCGKPEDMLRVKHRKLEKYARQAGGGWGGQHSIQPKKTKMVAISIITIIYNVEKIKCGMNQQYN